MKPSKTALLIVDVINDLEFPGGEKVLPWGLRMVPRLLKFRGQARRAGLPVIYANDNFGDWRSGWEQIVRRATRRGARGAPMARRLRPGKRDYLILKPRHSAFYSTALGPLLQDLDIEHLILAGIATNLCVLFSAHDAHMRQFKLTVLSDCCAAESDFDHDIALRQLERFCSARVCLSSEYWEP